MTEEPMVVETGRVERYPCPLCDWMHDELERLVSANALASVFGMGMMQVVSAQQKAQRVEEALREHFKTHTTEQWLAKVSSLQWELDKLKATFP